MPAPCVMACSRLQQLHVRSCMELVSCSSSSALRMPARAVASRSNVPRIFCRRSGNDTRRLHASAVSRNQHKHPDEADSGPSNVTLEHRSATSASLGCGPEATVRPRHLAKDDFFTASQQASPNAEEQGTVSSQARERLLQVCNTAVLHARDSAAPAHLSKIRQVLREAAEVYLKIIQDGRVRHTKDVYYESYLIRSTYLSVIRTVAAVNGRESIGVYTRMMCDYLVFERELVDRNVASLTSAPEPFDKADMTGKQLTQSRDMRVVPAKDLSYLEWAFFQTPLPQDATPTIYDIFCDFAAAPWVSAEAQTARDGLDRSSYGELAQELLQTVRALPIAYWARPITPDWAKFRSRRVPIAETGAQLIVSCQLILIRRIADNGNLAEAYQEYCRALDYSASQSTLSKASDNLVGLLNKRRLQLERGTSGVRDPGVLLQEYLAMLEAMMLDLRDGGRATSTREQRVVAYRWSLVMVCALRLHRLPLELAPEALVKSKAIKRSFLELIDNLSAGKLTHMHDGLALDDVRERIVEALASGYASKNGATSETILPYLSFLSSHADVEPPSDRTCLTLLSMTKGRLWPALFEAALQTLYLSAQQTLRQELKAPRSMPQSYRGRMAWILEAAVLQNDSEKVVTILQGLWRVFSKQRLSLLEPSQASRDAKALFRSIGVSPTNIILLLFPSLDVRETRGIRKQKRRRAARKLEGQAPLHPAVPFTAPVLLTSLTLAMRLGHTGLAERIWLLIRRVQRVMEQYRVDGYTPYTPKYIAHDEADVTPSKREERERFFRTALQTIPQSVYTTMFKVYTLEVQSSLRHVRLRSSRLSSARSASRMAIGFGNRMGIEPYSPRAPYRPVSAAEAARSSAQVCYEEIRLSWSAPGEDDKAKKKGPAPDAALYRALLGPWQRDPRPRRRFVDLQSWQGSEYEPFLRLVREDMARFDISLEDCNVRFWAESAE